MRFEIVDVTSGNLEVFQMSICLKLTLRMESFV